MPKHTVTLTCSALLLLAPAAAHAMDCQTLNRMHVHQPNTASEVANAYLAGVIDGIARTREFAHLDPIQLEPNPDIDSAEFLLHYCAEHPRTPLDEAIFLLLRAIVVPKGRRLVHPMEY